MLQNFFNVKSMYHRLDSCYLHSFQTEIIQQQKTNFIIFWLEAKRKVPVTTS